MPPGIGYDPRIFASGQTAPLQQEQQRMQEAMQFLDQLVSGQQPTGLTGRLSERNRIIGLLGDIMSDFGPGAVSPQAVSTWVDPALSGDINSRNQALGFLAQQAALTGQVDPRLQGFIGGQMGSTMMDRTTRGNLLASLAGQFAGEDWFNQAYQQHLQSAAPGGSLMGTPVANWGAAAAPFFAMQEALGGPEGYAAAGLPGVQIPMGGNMMPVNVQDYVTALHRSAAALAGSPEIGPEGPARQTSRQRAAEILQSVDEAIRNWATMQFLQPTVTGLGGATPASTIPAAPSPQGTISPQPLPAQGAATPPAAPVSAPLTQDQTSAGAVQAIQNTLASQGASAQWTIANLQARRPQLTQLLGPEGFNALVMWAQTLPNDPAWTPPWGVDPLQAVIDVMSGSR